MWKDDSPQMHCSSGSPQGKDILSWEVRNQRAPLLLFSPRREQQIAPVLTPTPQLSSFLSRTPQAHGLQESTNIDGDDLSPFPTIGIPAFRARVLYVPQRPSLLPGTPRDFLHSILELKSHRTYSKNKKSEKVTPQDVFDRAVEVGSGWGVDAESWQREWSNLSGGESQRIALAVALALNTAEILLLDGE